MTEQRANSSNEPSRAWRVPAEFCGAAIAALGGLAFLAPLFAPDLAAAAFAGILLAAGAFGALALAPGRGEHFMWRATWVAAASLTGLAVLFHHWTGRPPLSWVVGLGSIALAVIAAGQFLQEGRRGRALQGWLTVGGVFTLALGALLVRSGAHTGTMIMALFIAGNLVVFGLSLVVGGLIARAGASLL